MSDREQWYRDHPIAGALFMVFALMAVAFAVFVLVGLFVAVY